MEEVNNKKNHSVEIPKDDEINEKIGLFVKTINDELRKNKLSLLIKMVSKLLSAILHSKFCYINS